MSKRNLRLGFILHGVGPGWDDWRHPDAQVDASTSFAFYKRQAQVAERMGTKASAVARLESALVSGKHSPSIDTLRKYAAAVGKRLEVHLV